MAAVTADWDALQHRKSRGISIGQNGTGAGFLPVLRFLLPLIHSINCSTIITIYHPGLPQQANEWPQ
jgi:hypothetical protein